MDGYDFACEKAIEFAVGVLSANGIKGFEPSDFEVDWINQEDVQITNVDEYVSRDVTESYWVCIESRLLDNNEIIKMSISVDVNLTESWIEGGYGPNDGQYADCEYTGVSCELDSIDVETEYRIITIYGRVFKYLREHF